MAYRDTKDGLVLDLSAPYDEAVLAEKLDAALRNCGFVFVKAEPFVRDEDVRAVWHFAKAFHALPASVKEPLARHARSSLGYEKKGHDARFENAFPETTTLAQGNQWPDEDEDANASIRGMRAACAKYADAINALGKTLIHLLERAMHIEDKALADAFEHPQGALNMRHYPPIEKDESRLCCVRPHTDSGVFTFLAQQDKPGFEYCTREGEWVPVVAPGDDAYKYILVQAGDLLRRWTCHRFTSALHRVVHEPGRGDRYAIPIFWGPSESVVMRALRGIGDPNLEDAYEACTFAEYEAKFAEASQKGNAFAFTTLSTLSAAQQHAAKVNAV